MRRYVGVVKKFYTNYSTVLAQLMVRQRDAPGLVLFGNDSRQALPARASRLLAGPEGAWQQQVLACSAVTGEGLSPLLELIEGRLGAEDTVYEILLDPQDGQGQAWLHDRGEVLSRRSFEDGRILMKVRLTADKAGQAQARFGTAGMDPVQAMFGASVAGLIGCLPVALLTGQMFNPLADFGRPEAALVGSSALHALIYATYVWLAFRAGAVFASQCSYIVTGAGIFWAMVLLGERFPPSLWLSLVLLLVGVALVSPREKAGREVSPAL